MKQKLELYRLNLKSRIRNNIKDLKKYCIILNVGLVLMLFLLYLLTSIFNIYYLVSFIIAYIIALSFDFLLVRKFIFNNFNPKSIHAQYLRFIYSDLAFFLINIILLRIFVEKIHLFYLLSQIAISIILFPMKFFWNKSHVFSHK